MLSDAFYDYLKLVIELRREDCLGTIESSSTEDLATEAWDKMTFEETQRARLFCVLTNEFDKYLESVRDKSFPREFPDVIIKDRSGE